MKAAGSELVGPDPAQRISQAPATNDLSTHLGIMSRSAEAMLQQPLRPLTENQRGYIETVAVDSAGLLWFSGWLSKDHPLEFPAILVDRRKIAAAVLLTCFDRPDLPEDAHAVFGVVRVDWRPSQNGGDVFLFFGEEMRLYMRGVRPLRVVTSAQALELFEGVKSFCYGRHTTALQRMLSSVQNWFPETGRVAGFPVHVGADRVLVLPPFGCMIEGWIISPLKPIERFILKFGDCFLYSDPIASYFKERPDLEGAFPNYPHLISRAGFVALFRGKLSAAELIDPILKIVFTDGSSTNHQISSGALQRLGHSSSLDDALSFYPSLQHETFFSDFADGVRREQAAKLVPPESFVMAPSVQVMAFAVPTDRSDAYLLFADVLHQVEQMAEPPGLIFIAARGHNRSSTVMLFRNLAAACAAPCSLFFVEDANYALYGLVDVLRAVGAKRFLFTSAGVYLTASGWKSVQRVLASDKNRIDFFATSDDLPTHGAGPISGNLLGSPACFAWSTAALAGWMSNMPLFIGGFHDDNGLRHARVSRAFHRGGARRVSEARPKSLVATYINRDVALASEAANHV